MYPSRDAIYQWLDKHPEFADKYAHAKELRAESKNDQMLDVIEDLRSGKIDANMARVEIDLLKWQASKENPRRYGDTTTIKGDKDNPLVLTALASALDERIQKRVEHSPLQIDRPKE